MRPINRFLASAFVLAAAAGMTGRWEAARAEGKAKAPPAKKLSNREARALLEDYWVEVKVVRAGKELDPAARRGWSFVPGDAGL